MVLRSESLSFATVFVLGFGLLICTTAVSEGQAPGRGRRVSISTDELLRIEQVRSELDLSPEQQDRLQQLRESTQTSLKELVAGLQSLEPAARQKRLPDIQKKAQEYNQDYEREVAGILTTSQKERLNQLRIQLLARRLGTATVLGSQQIAEKLQLTDDQRKTLLSIQRQIQMEMAEKLRELRDRARPKIMDSLTPEQRKIWEQLIGKEVEFPSVGQTGEAGGQGNE